MNLTKNIITAFLALLLANPACCCALRGCGSTSEAEPVKSCCSVSTDGKNGDENTPDKEHNCQCSMDDQYTEQGKIDVIAPAVTPLPEPTFIELAEGSYAPVLMDMPDLSAHPPPWSPLRILYSVFRI